MPQGWGFIMTFCLRGRGFALSLCQGGGELAYSKNSPGLIGLGGEGMVRLGIVELTDTLRKYWNFSLVFLNPKTPFESSYYLYVKRLTGKQLVYNQCLTCNQRTYSIQCGFKLWDHIL